MVTNASTVTKTAIDGVIQVAPGANASLASPLLTVNANSTVNTVNPSLNAVAATVTVGDGPRDVAITPDGARAYVINRDANTVSVINTATNIVATTISGFSQPRGSTSTRASSPSPAPS